MSRQTPNPDFPYWVEAYDHADEFVMGIEVESAHERDLSLQDFASAPDVGRVASGENPEPESGHVSGR